MSWRAIKHFFTKAWLWCKHNWKFVALVVYTVLLYLLFSKNARNAKKMLSASREAHKAEIDALNKSHTDVLRKRKENLERYKEIIASLDAMHREENERLTSEKKKRVREIVDEHGDDTEKLAELLSETFGFEIFIEEEDD